MKEFIRNMLKAGRNKDEIAVLTLAKFHCHTNKAMILKIDNIIKEVEENASATKDS